MTDYIVLTETEPGHFVVVGGLSARSARDAIRDTAKEMEKVDAEVLYVAVPRRSWSLVPVKVEQQTRVLVGP